MRFAIAAALVAGVSANYNATAPAVAYTTEIVSAYVTYCPGPTTIAHGNVTYTVTEATTLTITNCPCTITKPVYTSATTICSSSTVVPPAPAYTAPSNVTKPSPSLAPPAAPAPSINTSAGNSVVASGSALFALFALAGYVL